MGLTYLSRNVCIQLPTCAASVPEDLQPQLRRGVCLTNREVSFLTSVRICQYLFSALEYCARES